MRITFKNLKFLLLIVVFPAGCSYTPGDAALRVGHIRAAANIYKQGAEKGDGTAALKLGLLVNDGYLSADSYGTAAEWFRRACDDAVMVGCHDLGVSYEYGRAGVKKDYTQALVYYRQAAEHGYLQSQYNLGTLYANNYIDPPNDLEGYKWMLIAQRTARGCKSEPVCNWILEDPSQHIKTLRLRLTAAAIIKAQELADQWISEN